MITALLFLLAIYLLLPLSLLKTSLFENAQELVTGAHHIVHGLGVGIQAACAKYLENRGNPLSGFVGIVLALIYDWGVSLHHQSQAIKVKQGGNPMTEEVINLSYFVVIVLVIGIVFFLLLHPSNYTSSSAASLGSIICYLFSP